MHFDDEAADYSKTFAELRGKLVRSDGQRYVLFVRSLKADYRRVRRDIALGYLWLVVSLCLTIVLPSVGVHPLLAAFLGAISIGFWIAYLALFLHEGAHYNLADDKLLSDKICNWTISWLVGSSISTYRGIHFQHHRELGTVNDSELSYFFPMNLIFLLKAATGIRVLEVLLDRKRNAKTALASSAQSGPPLALIGLAIHGIIISACYFSGFWWAAAAWTFGLGLGFPFFASVRQILEHRDDAALATTDYRMQDHGAYTRLFGDDLFSSFFGGAGFNRHLLHHWEPQVSYTNLAELESFLEDTPVKAIMDKRRTSYPQTLQRLFSLR